MIGYDDRIPSEIARKRDRVIQLFRDKGLKEVWTKYKVRFVIVPNEKGKPQLLNYSDS